MEHDQSAPNSGGSVGARAGMVCTAVLATAYLAFVLISTVAADWMGQPMVAGGMLPISFALGFGIMGLGFALTCIYAIIANAAEKSGG